MIKSKNEKQKRHKRTPSWFLEHFLLPILVVYVGITLNNYYQAKKQPNLVAYEEEHQTMKISEDKFKMKCPFTIVNNGGSTIKSRKVTLLIPRSATIDAIDISEEYKSFYDISDGGCGYHYTVISVDLPRDKTIEGSIAFYSNVEIPTKSMCPLKIIY